MDPFFLTFDTHPPADPIPAGLDDDPVLTFATIHGLSPLFVVELRLRLD
jgi:hypothetical protein